jgi:hypothetical protein
MPWGYDMSRRRSTALSPPEMFLLDAWGHSLRAAFGATPYLVGSVERGEDWRDVDVRMILDDAEYETLLGDDHPERMTGFNIAISYWGQRATALPVDFQFQARAHATARYGDQPRNPLGARTGLHFLDHEPRPVSGDSGDET